ncbi:MAG TPA: sugar transferase [bacterium]|nr:sugar transferase [bacterium]
MGKRIFDLFFSLIGLVILSPLFLVIAMLIKLDSEGPIFFRQERVGLRGRLFNIYKFRTMAANAEKIGGQITVGQDSRITRIGRSLRRFNLDELPQLINVSKGEVSLVGPRPELPKYVELYSEEQKRVLSVKPGMTDYASIKFNKENEILAGSSHPEDDYVRKITPQKIILNLKYINDQSLLLDFKLILRTLNEILGEIR